MNARQRPNDPRIAEIVKHLKILAKRHNRRLVTADYLAYRDNHAKSLPAMTTLYRLFGSFPEALAAAGVDQAEKVELGRTADEDLDNCILFVAKELDTDTLSSHAYDRYRDEHPDATITSVTGDPMLLKSSSVIRKWRNNWSEAVARVGLKTTSRAAPRKIGGAEIIDALRRAKGEIEGLLTPHAYTSLVASYPEDQRDQWPSTQDILKQFPNWEAALRAADVEQSDALHPKALWSAEEARRIWTQCKKLAERSLGQPLTEDLYERMRAGAKRPMPTWQVMRDLLSDGDADIV